MSTCASDAADRDPRRYRLYSWEHSYFSGQVRAYLRF